MYFSSSSAKLIFIEFFHGSRHPYIVIEESFQNGMVFISILSMELPSDQHLNVSKCLGENSPDESSKKTDLYEMFLL